MKTARRTVNWRSIMMLWLIFCLPFVVSAQKLKWYIGKDNLYYAKDQAGNIVIPPKYSAALDFSEGLAAVKIDGKWGFINKRDQFVIPPKYSFVHSFSEGLAAVMIDDKMGYIDKTGQLVIPAKFSSAGSFSEGLAPAALTIGKYGFIDKTGQFVIQPNYFKTFEFSEGLAPAWADVNYCGFIDKTGRQVIPMSYHFVGGFKYGVAQVKIFEKWGAIDKSGREIVPVQYKNVAQSPDGSIHAWKGSTCKYYDYDGNIYNSQEEYTTALDNKLAQLPLSQYLIAKIGSFEDYLRKNEIVPLTQDALRADVQIEVENWQKKGEFESTAKWKLRVNEKTREAKAKEIAAQISKENDALIKDARAKYEAKYKETAQKYCDKKAAKFARQTMTLKPYDADNETFLISTSTMGDILLPVPADKAPAFKANWESIKQSAKAVYVPAGKDVALQSVQFGEYVYDSNTKADYAMTDVDYNFRPLDLSAIDYNFAPLADGGAATTVATTPGKTVQPKTVQPEVRHVQGGTLADVDANIPQGTRKADKTFAVIIANGKYAHASAVANAANDGESMAKYLTRTLGIPAEQVKTYTDATYGTMTSAVAYLGDIARAYGNEPFNVIFYYVGHGLPDDESKEAYMLPVDANPRITRACYPLNQLYKELAELNAANVTVMIDACFSGSNYGDGMLVADARGAVIKAKESTPTGKMVVLTASQAGQTAFPYNEKSHGMFTYYILKKLQETRGNVTLGELSDYVTDQVSKKSITINNKPQTPTVAVSPEIRTTWRSLPFGR